MLELIDLDQRVAKEECQQVFPELERRLGECQRLARAAGVPVVVVFEGWEAAGKGTLINRLAHALDPRGFKVNLVGAPDKTERMHPWMWRHWGLLPTAGNWAIFDQSWYGRVLAEPVEGNVEEAQLQQAYEDIREFERQLVDSGAVVVKLWLHIDKREQKRRFKQLLRHRATAWKVGKCQRRQHRQYEQWLEAVEAMIEQTGTAAAPWTVVEATQRRFSRLKVFRTVLDTVCRALERRAEQAKLPAAPTAAKPEPAGPPPAPRETILERVDLSLALSREEYEARLDELQQRLFKAENGLFLSRVPAVIVYEGWDAAGKGGNIKRLTQAMDPRGYEVVPICAPTAEEKAHPYLWRFWRHVPKAGHLTIFDRSWYGRVLVERVEGFCSKEEWRRAYAEINAFERQLADAGTVVVKFWLHIDRDEQLRRFQERQAAPYKQWKITDEDWRNREKWPQYESAVIDMLEQTSTLHAPWTILESNCKLHARIKALATVLDALRAGIHDHVRG